MAPSPLVFENIHFTYDAAGEELFAGINAHFPAGWTGVVGANGSGKTTLLRLAVGNLSCTQGTIRGVTDSVYCSQRTDDAPSHIRAFLDANDGEALQLKGRLGIRAEWLPDWKNLSHGERKRAQIAVALWRRPRILAIDEPTNHLDSAARELLMRSLRHFRGVGLIVSHDGELLDSLCQQCLYLEPPVATMRPGGYSRGSEQARREEQSARLAQSRVQRARKRLQREAVRRRNEASRADRRRSKRGLDRKDSDARTKIDAARVSGRDGVAGRQLRQLQGRIRQASQSEQQITVKKEKKLRIWLTGSTSTRNSLFSLAAGALPLGASGRLSYPDLSMAPTDRIAITGPNGAGKSTLIRHIVDNLKLPEDRVTYLPQEISWEKSVEAMSSVRQLAHERLGHLMTVVSCLGSDPLRVLETLEPSPGEMRKVLLGIGIGHCPHLIIMDEPTNHLDLPSIECLERALADCPCGLLLVSHDERFLASLTRTRWRVTVVESADKLVATLSIE